MGRFPDVVWAVAGGRNFSTGPKYRGSDAIWMVSALDVTMV